MKKTRVLIIFILWLALGVLTQQVVSRYQAIKAPVLEPQHFDMETLIDSIADVIHPEKYTINDDKYQRFDEVSKILGNAFYDKSKIQSWTKTMLTAALKAYVNAIGDPYTIYMDAVTQSWFDAALKGEEDFEWIGAVVRKKDYYVLVEEVLKDSPASKAGIKPLDRIIAVDSGSVKDLNINEAVNKIKWPKDTKVNLVIERLPRKRDQVDGAEKLKKILKISVTRDKLLIPSVRSKILTWVDSLGNKKTLWYIDIAVIWEETESLFKREVLLLKDAWVQWMILDLRGNWGWYLTVWVQIASHFIPKWQKVVSAKYRLREPEEYYSQWFGDLEWIPVVVLVDELTASAGEIIAMALQEQIWAKLIGMTTFGKWSIQTMEVFDDGASLKYTVGKRFSPSGKNIDEIGVKPDIEVALDVDKYLDDGSDSQLEKAKSVVSGMIK